MKIVLERLSDPIEISELCRKYRITTKRMHSSLNYLTPRDYYRGDPDELLRLSSISESSNFYVQLWPSLLGEMERNSYPQTESNQSCLRFLLYWTQLELDNLIEETCLHRHKSQQVGITVTHQEVIN